MHFRQIHNENMTSVTSRQPGTWVEPWLPRQNHLVGHERSRWLRAEINKKAADFGVSWWGRVW